MYKRQVVQLGQIFSKYSQAVQILQLHIRVAYGILYGSRQVLIKYEQ